MDALSTAQWASRNGFFPYDESRFRKVTDKAHISIEIKKASIVMIYYLPKEEKPRILTRLFKDIADDITPESFIPLL